MTRRKLTLVSILAVLVLGGAAGFYWFGSGTGKASFRTAPVERGDIQSTISTSNRSRITTLTSGTSPRPSRPKPRAAGP